MDDCKALTIFAPAKVNLYLHVTGRRDDGYHLLDSLVTFANTGDTLHISPAQDFALTIDGPYAAAFNAKEKDFSPHSSNLVARAAWDLAHITKKTLNLKIHLTKNLPLGAGLGGGSSDAAATLWGLCAYWNLPKDSPVLQELFLKLGADIPVCFAARSARLQGIGEHITPIELPEIPVVLVHPGIACKTASVFSQFDRPFKIDLEMRERIDTLQNLIDFLKTTENDLLTAACKDVPAIRTILNALEKNSSCPMARMSGSGSSCFGIFMHEKDAIAAAQILRTAHPEWWIEAAWLGRTERY